MGQYYTPIVLDKETKSKPRLFARCYDFGSGAKLMEHSWDRNPFVGLIEKYLIDNPQPLVWAGDYADNEPVETIDKDVFKLLLKENEEYDKKYADRETKYAEEFKKEGTNLYNIISYMGVKLSHHEDVKDNNVYQHNFKSLPAKYKYLVNHDKKEFVDKSKTPKDSDGWRMHPLPILTCEGNGRGGGDFRGESPLVGYWSRDTISVQSRKSDIPKGYNEVLFNLKEN